MHSFIFLLLGFLSSVITAFPTLQTSNDHVDDFLDFTPSFSQEVQVPSDSDVIAFNPVNNLNDASENLFSNSAYADSSNDDPLSSSGTVAVNWDGLSSAGSLSPSPGPQSESENLFDENSGSIALSSSSDTLSLSQFPINQDISYDDTSSSSSLLDDGNLISTVVDTTTTQTLAGSPSCSSLKVRNSNVVFQSLCCESPCMDIQSWRSNCRSCNSALPLHLIFYSCLSDLLNERSLLNIGDASCPHHKVACCQIFNVGLNTF